MFFLFVYWGKADVGLAVVIVLAAMMVAIKIRWNLRKHVWFWAMIAVILALHVPLVFVVRWPQGNVPTLFYTFPFALIDFVIISGALKLAEKLLFEGFFFLVGMSRARIVGVALLIVLGAGLFSRITDRAGVPPKNPASAPVEICAIEAQPVTETVDLANGNLHVEIPIRAVRQKTAAPLSHQ